MNKLTYIAELCQNHLGEKYVDNMANSVLDQVLISSSFNLSIQKTWLFRPEFENGLKKGKSVLAIEEPYLNEFKD